MMGRTTRGRTNGIFYMVTWPVLFHGSSWWIMWKANISFVVPYFWVNIVSVISGLGGNKPLPKPKVLSSPQLELSHISTYFSYILIEIQISSYRNLQHKAFSQVLKSKQFQDEIILTDVFYATLCMYVKYFVHFYLIFLMFVFGASALIQLQHHINFRVIKCNSFRTAEWQDIV